MVNGAFEWFIAIRLYGNERIGNKKKERETYLKGMYKYVRETVVVWKILHLPYFGSDYSLYARVGFVCLYRTRVNSFGYFLFF